MTLRSCSSRISNSSEAEFMGRIGLEIIQGVFKVSLPIGEPALPDCMQA